MNSISNPLLSQSVVALLVLFAIGIAATGAIASETASKFDQAAISPDGKRVAWIGPAGPPNANDDAGVATSVGLYVKDLEDPAGGPIRINSGELTDAAVSDAA